MNAMIQTVRGLGPMRVVILGLMGVVMMALFAFLSFRLSAPSMAPVYSNLSMEDSGEIAVELDKLGTKYEVGANGTQILVPANEVNRIRISLAQKGLPSHGSIVGYEIFDKSDALGTSNFVHNVNLLRALEGELARTISSFDNVSAARVHLVMPRRQVFEREKVEPSASVVVTLRNRSQKLSREESASISNLIATAVPGLKLSRITIVDNKGKLLARGETDPEDMTVAATDAEEFRVNYESRLKQTIEQLLEQSVGAGKARAEVSADIGFDRIVKNSEVYDPNGQVVRSVQTSEAKEFANDGDSGNVSVGNNLPDALPAKADAASAGSGSERTEETTNFEISRTVTNHISEIGVIKKLSVAVLVDGTYTLNEETQERTYQPRSEEELEKLRTLVRSTMGFDEKRGDLIEVVNMPFSREDYDEKESTDPFEWLKRDLHNILKTLVIGVVAVLVIMLVIRPMVNRAFEIAPVEEQAMSAPLGGGGGEGLNAAVGGEEEPTFEIEQIQSRMKLSTSKKVNELADSNPEETLNILRNWMTQK